MCAARAQAFDLFNSACHIMIGKIVQTDSRENTTLTLVNDNSSIII